MKYSSAFPTLLMGLTLVFTQVLIKPANATDLEVVVSIKPIHSLAAAIMQGVASPKLLIKGDNSPHTFNMRPSDARMLSRANVIFWVGESVELFLIKPLVSLASSAHVVPLSKTKGLHLLALRTQHHESHDEGSHTHASAQSDPHFWLNIDNAKIIATEITKQLSAKDRENAGTYTTNLAKLHHRLDHLQSTLKSRLEPVTTRPFIVFHDAFQYFEKSFNLTSAGTIALSPERAPGAKKLREIREKITKEHISCVFAEPQFKPAIIAPLIQNTNARQAILDPLGAGIPPGPDAYGLILTSLAHALVSCLTQATNP